LISRRNYPDETIRRVLSLDRGREPVIRLMADLDGIPGASEAFTVMLWPGAEPRGKFSSRLVTLQMIRRLDLVVGVAAIRVPIRKGRVDCVLRDGSLAFIAPTSDANGAEHLNSAIGRMRRVQQLLRSRPVPSLNLVPGAHFGSRFLLVHAGLDPVTRERSVEQLSSLGADVLLLDGRAFAMSGHGEAISTVFARKQQQLALLPSYAPEQEVAALLTKADPVTRQALLDIPAAHATLIELVREHRIDVQVLSQLLHNPLFASPDLSPLFDAVRVLASVPGVDQAVERLAASTQIVEVLGHSHAIFRAAEIHRAEGLAAMAIPMPGQSLDIDGITVSGILYEAKLLSSDPHYVRHAIRDASRQLWRLHNMVTLLRGELPALPTGARDHRLMLVTTPVLSPEQAAHAAELASRRGVPPHLLASRWNPPGTSFPLAFGLNRPPATDSQLPRSHPR
jgi:hypothetical protein